MFMSAVKIVKLCDMLTAAPSLFYCHLCPQRLILLVFCPSQHSLPGSGAEPVPASQLVRVPCTLLLLEWGVIMLLIHPLSFLPALFLLCLTLLERVSYGENSYLVQINIQI